MRQGNQTEAETAGNILKFCAVLEAVTGLALIAVPSFVTRLLFHEAVSGIGFLISRLCGIGLLSLGIAYWPSRAVAGRSPEPYGILTYNALVTLYLIFIGIGGGGGKLLWAVAVLHLVLTILLLRHVQQANKHRYYEKREA